MAARAWQNFRVLTSGRALDIRAGDFVAFDSFLPHRGSTPNGLLSSVSEDEKRAGCVRVTPDRAKIVIYFNASRAGCAHTYMRHSLSRGMDELRNLRDGSGTETFFSDFPGLRYPADYPHAFADALRANGIGMAQLEGEELTRAVGMRTAALSCAAVLNCIPAA